MAAKLNTIFHKNKIYFGFVQSVTTAAAKTLNTKIMKDNELE